MLILVLQRLWLGNVVGQSGCYSVARRNGAPPEQGSRRAGGATASSGSWGGGAAGFSACSMPACLHACGRPFHEWNRSSQVRVGHDRIG